MKTQLYISITALLVCAMSLTAQPRSRGPAASTDAPTGDYASDITAVLEAEEKALGQARQMLEGDGNTRDKAALETAVKEMERARTSLAEAKNSPDKLPAALSAEQAAYQALLKALPREYRMSRSRNRSQSGNSSGQPSQQEMSQLELPDEKNRYETERQAQAPQTQQQREQAQTVDRLKQLARRQQDLNERLRDLQTALQEAKTDKEREDAQRQLKRLRDEERQMLSDVDELRQQMEQSPNAAQQAEARQQLEQTRNDVQRAAQNMERQSVSEALASGARAEQQLQNLRENLRQQSSSQFTQQMRDLRSQARDLAEKENQIARDLAALDSSGQKQLDDAVQRRALAEQMNRQQTALTNMLNQARVVTEQAETTEPLLSKQLYDVVRRADQMRTENQLDVGAQLVERGFLPQASQMERSAGKNIDELRQGIDRAAESVLGSEADALRYAQKELDDLARSVESELASAPNATPGGSGQNGHDQTGTNAPSQTANRADNRNGNRGDTNAVASASSPGEGQAPGDSEQNSQSGQPNQGRNGQSRGQNNQARSGQQPGQGQQSGEQQGQGQGQQGGQRGQQAGNSQNGNGQGAGEGQNQPDSENQGGQDGRDRLRQAARQMGGARGGSNNGGPITGASFIDWTDRLRDVEQAVDSQDVRNQLATARERVGVYRRSFREAGLRPDSDTLRKKVLGPLTLARDWVGQELSRAQNERSLVPLDRDPVQDKYSELVRKYYEKLGSTQ